MEQKALAKWLKGIIIGVGICGLIIYILVIPNMASNICTQYPEFSNRFWPWLGFIWATGIPCLIALGIAWKIASNIGNDMSFTEMNAKLLKWITILASGDAGFFFIGNIIMMLFNMSHPSVVLASFIVSFAGISIGVASAVLSHLVKKAAVLQEESDLTI